MLRIQKKVKSIKNTSVSKHPNQTVTLCPRAQINFLTKAQGHCFDCINYILSSLITFVTSFLQKRFIIHKMPV